MSGTCQAKGCGRPTDGVDTICEVCSLELEVLMRDGLRKRLGREPTSAEFDVFIDRLLARAVDPRKVRP